MDRIESLRAFTAVVDAGGFASAARTLGVSRSVVNKAVIALEGALGTQLLRRSTRQVTATEAGQAFYARSLRVLSEFDDAVASVGAWQARPAGRLRVNAPMSFGTLHLADAVARYMAEWPEVQVELVLNDRFVDPIEEGFDVTLRIGAEQVFTSLVVRQIATIALVLCASPAYLQAHGAPVHPEELKHHRCLHYGWRESGSQWRLKGPTGERSYAVGCVMWSNNGEALMNAAVQHAGIALLPTFIVGAALRQGRLLPLLTEWAAPSIRLSALYPRHRHASPKVRSFVDWLDARWRDVADWRVEL